ncbi:acetyl-CoA synthetase-like protein [Aspergillus candidus]|uniref:Acetyl-CoA synthetase-like protein n=1 Tax=Aspergillus candidus TaxID=41067 RepID=A0A2I2EZA5_ASPCN|nr:acetyl-CoA synthetase-like protein [Aspergillus candidus]PLB33705.1 acetyl-CoA synthetase-like protein [Aspergillus candidus]
MDLQGQSDATFTLDLIPCYQAIWKRLPERVKSGKDKTGWHDVDRVHALVKARSPTIAECLHPNSDRPALIEPRTKQSMSHATLARFVQQFDIGLDHPSCSNRRVAVVLPNGPVLALANLAVSNYYTLMAMTPAAGPVQLREDITRAEIGTVLALAEDIPKLQLQDPWVDEAGIRIISVQPRDDLTFDMTPLNCGPLDQRQSYPPKVNSPDDVALMLFTSGSSGNKKLVPIPKDDYIARAVWIMDAFELTEDDGGLNVMPLHHVGGFFRSLCSNIFAGGFVVCCPAFDPTLVVDVIESWPVTWYYGVPTMHHLILQELESRPNALRNSAIRVICNAAANLPPTLATRLLETFKCTVLPSYGLTECMPVSSAPLSYRLERPGSSGQATGPELAILSMDGRSVESPRGTTGRICLRGSPVIPGYLKPEGLDRSAFDENGWFETGDLGFMDDDGYLYITGRSKEVINRGGEIISPAEIDEAILSASTDPNNVLYHRVSQVLSFSVPHDTLQETVGVALVLTPDAIRPDLRQLHEGLHGRLERVQFPQCIVYMEGGIPLNQNKPQRIKLSERLNLVTLSDTMRGPDRYTETGPPPLNRPLTEPIAKQPCVLRRDEVTSQVKAFSGQPEVVIRENPIDGLFQVIVFNQKSDTFDTQALVAYLRVRVPGYEIPTSIRCIDSPMPVNPVTGEVDESAVDKSLAEAEAKLSGGSIKGRAGGDSLRAGRLAGDLRAEFKIRLSVDTLLTSGTVDAITEIVEAQLAKKQNSNGEDAGVRPPQVNKTHSSTNPFLLMVQLIPIMFFFPLKHALLWTTFIYLISETKDLECLKDSVAVRVIHIGLVGAGSKLATEIAGPIGAIMIKWLLIGRYQQGLYPMWGLYHTRWWLAQKAVQVGGKGIFSYWNWSRLLYYRCLGAKIGRNVEIDEKASLGEHDLIELGDGVRVAQCIIRPFAVEANTSMLLGRIRVGPHSTVGLKSILAPGADLPAYTQLGPNSSSWEIPKPNEKTADSPPTPLPECHWFWTMFVIEPIAFIVTIIRRVPWAFGIIPIARNYPAPGGDVVLQSATWYASPSRISYHIVARVSNTLGAPLFALMCVIILRKVFNTICGRPQPGPTASESQRQRVRRGMMKRLLPSGSLQWVTQLFGVHYEGVSILMRALGAKVGKRIYWPSNGPSVGDLDLFEVGNDVVFGSRSFMVTADGYGQDRIRIGDGTMVADRTVLLPGTDIGERVMVGSGALMRRNQYYAPGTIWVGSKKGESFQIPRAGDVTDEKPTKSPFGRAFYDGEADYYVLSQFEIMCYSVFSIGSIAVYWTLGTVTSLVILAHTLESKLVGTADARWRPAAVFGILGIGMAATSIVQAVIAMVVVIAGKWAIMGRRQEGEYHWDRSSYNQRWQAYLAVERLIKKCYGRSGVLGLLTGTHWLVIYLRALGANIGRDCAIHANGNPSLPITEPDLLTLGDRVAVDDASLVAHLNSRGDFELHPLSVGDRSVMRSGTRLLSAASMGSDACLLEHTLVLSGDHVDDGLTLQGWPAEEAQGARIPFPHPH